MDNSIFRMIELDDELLQEIQVFASQLKDNYKKRNQDNAKAKFEQAIDGKVGEWIAYEALRPFFMDLTPPDMKIYAAHEKNWNSDMTSGELGFACKTCSHRSAQSNTPSWIFNKKDKDGFGKDTEIHEDYENKIAVMVQLEKERSTGKIRAIVPVAKLHERKLFVETKLERLKDFKDAVYLFYLNIEGLSDQIPKCTKEMIERILI